MTSNTMYQTVVRTVIFSSCFCLIQMHTTFLYVIQIRLNSNREFPYIEGYLP